jgi:hypothetical protein
MTHDHTCPLFAHVYEAIVECTYGAEVPFDAWSLDRMAAVWQGLRQSPLLRKKGTIVKRSRWFAHLSEANEYLLELGAFLLFTLVACIERGFYASIKDTPLHRTTNAEPNVGHLMDEDGDFEAGVPRGATVVKAEFEKRRKEAAGTIHLANQVLSSRTTRRLLQAMVLVGGSIHAAHSEQIHQCKTRRGCMEWHLMMIDEGWVGIYKKLFDTLRAPSTFTSWAQARTWSMPIGTTSSGKTY